MSHLAAVRTLVIDANLLLLLVIGTMDPKLIPRFKRTDGFTKEDYESLVTIAARADRIVTTPHVLTEVSNLANSLHHKQRDDFANHFRSIISTLDEHYTPAVTLAQHASFGLGIADVSMLDAARSALILTEDGRFASHVNSEGDCLALDLKTATSLSNVM